MTKSYDSGWEYFNHLYGLADGRPNLLRVLTYHRVGIPQETPNLDPRQISATPEAFDRQMRFLARHYNVVPMEQILEGVANDKQLPKGAVAITFDDAYRDVKEYAWPILKKYSLPATVFVPTAYPDQPKRSFWWDRLYSAVMHSERKEFHDSSLGPLSFRSDEERHQNLKKIQNHVKTLLHSAALQFIDQVCGALSGDFQTHNAVIGWEDLRQLAKEGLTLCAHTRTHPILTQIPLKDVRQEVGGALQDLKNKIDDVLPVFAYPNGNYNDDIIRIMKEEGYQLAFTARGGFNNLKLRDPFRIHRTNITRRTTLPVFRMRLKRWFSCIDFQRQVRAKTS